ncbi:MAG TPA: DUF1566 domain-containing protein [Thiobacillus sp.]
MYGAAVAVEDEVARFHRDALVVDLHNDLLTKLVLRGGEFRSGLGWPAPRFSARDEAVIDRLTGLVWRRAASLVPEGVRWQDALAAVARLNRDGGAGWRLPSINELESLTDCAAANPALAPDHPFTEVRDVYWSSTTSLYEPDWAWALYLDKGAVGVGQKSQARFHVWPVRENHA